LETASSYIDNSFGNVKTIPGTQITLFKSYRTSKLHAQKLQLSA